VLYLFCKICNLSFVPRVSGFSVRPHTSKSGGCTSTGTRTSKNGWCTSSGTRTTV